MTHIFQVPIAEFGAPFNRIWKRVLMHFCIAVFFGFLWMPVYNYSFVHALKMVFMLFISDLSQAFVHIIIYKRLSAKYDWILHTRERIIYTVSLHFLGLYIVYFAILTPCIHFLFDVSYMVAFQNLVHIWTLPLVFMAVSMTLVVSIEFFSNWKKAFATEEQLNAQMMNYKYEALRNQVNPHFLLDSFGTLKALVRSEPQRAVDFIQKMSDLYRRVLDVKDQEFIPLHDELNYLANYIELLKIRYKGELSIQVDIKPEYDDLIIPLSLQSLLEYAVEYYSNHGVGLASIHLLKRKDQIEMTGSKNHGQQMKSLDSPGLRILEQQYQFYSKRPIMYEENDQAFSILIPLLKQG
jgi:sensor histidine kinase YesM